MQLIDKCCATGCRSRTDFIVMSCGLNLQIRYYFRDAADVSMKKRERDRVTAEQENV